MYFIRFSAHHNDKNRLHAAVREKLKPFHNTLADSIEDILPVVDEIAKTESEKNKRCKPMSAQQQTYHYSYRETDQEFIHISDGGFSFSLTFDRVKPSPLQP